MRYFAIRMLFLKWASCTCIFPSWLCSRRRYHIECSAWTILQGRRVRPLVVCVRGIVRKLRQTHAALRGQQLATPALYNNVNAALMFPIAILAGGEFRMISFSMFFSGAFWILVLTAGVLGFLISYATMLQIHYTSPLAHSTLLLIILNSASPSLWIRTNLGHNVWKVKIPPKTSILLENSPFEVSQKGESKHWVSFSQ